MSVFNSVSKSKLNALHLFDTFVSFDIKKGVLCALFLSFPLFCLAKTSLLHRAQTESPPLFPDHSYRLNLSHIESKGIGYNQGYSTLAGFFTIEWDHFIPFFDIKGHVFNDGKWAGNAGIGTRYIFAPSNCMFGANVYYDYRKTKHLHYNQVGIGLETFLEHWEFRANGYLPIGKKAKTVSNTLTSISFKSFSGNTILINENYSKINESSMRGFNTEIGIHPCHFHKDYDLFLAAGGYYFNADNGQTTWGGKLRAKATITPYIFVELSNSYDHLFHHRFQGSLALSIPLGKKSSCLQKSTRPFLCWRALLPVERQEIIVVHKRKIEYTIDPLAINPVTGEPFFVIFVNNTNTNPTPNGTFENPFAHLTPADGIYNAQDGSNPGDILYIFPGSSSSLAQIGMNHGFSLQNNQRFLGSGISNQFLTTKGLLTIPPQTELAPCISNSDGVVMALTDHGEISGIHLYALGGNAAACISSGNPMINSATITENLLTGNGASNTSRGIFLATTLKGRFIIDRNTILSQGSNGIHLAPNTGPVAISLTHNTISNTHASGLFVMPSSMTNPITTLLVDNNRVTNALGILSSGIDIRGDRNITATVTNNRCTTNQENGILLFFSAGSDIMCDVRGNTTDNNQNSGIFMAAPSSGCIRFNDNTAARNNLHPFFWTQNSPAPGCQIELPTGNNGIIDSVSLTVQLVPVGTCGFEPDL